MKRSIIFLAGFFCILLVTCDNIFYTIASSGENELEVGEYIVKFDKNEGDIEASPLTMSAQAPTYTVMLPNVEPKRNGYLFTGWNTNADGSGTPFTRDTPVKDDITVYAQWVILPTGSFFVHFDKNHNDGSNFSEASPQMKAVTPPDTTIDALPAEPTRTGYDFTGWNTNADGSGTPFTRDTPVSAETTVYAQWNYTISGKITVEGTGNPLEWATIEINRNGGGFSRSFNPTDSSGNYTIKVPTGTYTITVSYPGYQTNTDTFTVSGNATRNISLLPITYTIVYDKNAGDASGSTASSTHTYDVDKSLTTNGFLRSGFIFSGWAIFPTGTREYTDGDNVKNLTTTHGDTVTLYAYWSLNDYSISFDTNDATGPIPPAQTVVYGNRITLPNGDGLSKSGYTFGGWNTQSDGDGINYPASSFYTPSGGTHDIILYAQWNEIITTPKYTVTFNINEGSGTAPGSQTVDAGSSIIIPSGEGLTKSGFIFDGWNTEWDGSGDNYDADDYYTPSGNITLYAQWNEIITTPKYTVTFDINGGSGTAPGSQTVDAGSSIIIPSGEGLTKSGFIFDGWNTEWDGSGDNYDVDDYYTPSGNSTLYAQWNEDGGTIPPPPTPTTVNGTVALAGDGEGNIEDVLVQLYQLVLPSELVPIGAPKKPTDEGLFSFTGLTADVIYIITASLDGYVTGAISLVPLHPSSVTLTLYPGVETRRASQSIDLQQLLMQSGEQ